tara:strand:- start:2276 stop:2665 length:390 start_codon:yes stop_codon:yes gene_type:complete
MINNLNYLYLDINNKHGNTNSNNNNNTNKPKLVEKNVQYFLKAILNNSKKIKLNTFNKYYNISMFLLFITIVSSVLFVKYKKTNNLQLKAEKNIKNQEYIYSKLLYYNNINNIEKQKIKNSMITNISEF